MTIIYLNKFSMSKRVELEVYAANNQLDMHFEAENYTRPGVSYYRALRYIDEEKKLMDFCEEFAAANPEIFGAV